MMGSRDISALILKSITKQKISFSNGSKIYIRPSFRSATLQRLHISELAKISNQKPHNARETRTGTMQTIHGKNTVVIESTAEGENMFSDMWHEAVQLERNGKALSTKDLKPVFLSWMDDPKCVEDVDQEETPESKEYEAELAEQGITLTPKQRNFWIMQRRELGEEVHTEYPATPKEAFKKSQEGTYYTAIYDEYVIKNGREIENLYEDGLPVQVAMDLGMSDYTALVYFQIHNDETRIIDEFRSNGQDVQFYVEEMRKSGKTINGVFHPYQITKVWLPHDAKVREMTYGTSIYQRFMDLKVPAQVVGKSRLIDGIDVTRTMLKNMWIDKDCSYLIRCLNRYSKEWDLKNQVWKEKEPVHNDVSHGADAIRYMAIATEHDRSINTIHRSRDDDSDYGIDY